MVIEAEVKVGLHEKRFNELEKMVRSRCEYMGENYQVDLYYNHPCRDFRVTDEAVRIRKEIKSDHEKVFLVYKGPRRKNINKIRVEVSVEVNSADIDELKEFLLKNDYKFVGTVEKIRRNYLCDNLIYSFDHVKRLGYFIEIELKNGEVSDLHRVIEELGFKEFIERRTYLELILKK